MARQSDTMTHLPRSGTMLWHLTFENLTLKLESQPLKASKLVTLAGPHTRIRDKFPRT